MSYICIASLHYIFGFVTFKWTRGKLKKLDVVLEYIIYVIGETAVGWSDGDILRVWFSCQFVPSERDVKMVATIEVCTKHRQH
jgi:hypothetical protein